MINIHSAIYEFYDRKIMYDSLTISPNAEFYLLTIGEQGLCPLLDAISYINRNPAIRTVVEILLAVLLS